MTKRKTSIVIQFNLDQHEIDDLFAFEASLTQGMEQNNSGFVDGNDIGGSNYNIYVMPKSGRLGHCMDNIKIWLKTKKLLNKAVIARITPSGNATVEHPANFTDEFSYGI